MQRGSPSWKLSKLDQAVRLTERRIEILALVGAGLTEKEVARRLGIHRDTVAEHLHACRGALSARTNAHLVAEAIRHGFLPPRA